MELQIDYLVNVTYGKKNSTIINSIRIDKNSTNSPFRGIQRPAINAPKNA